MQAVIFAGGHGKRCRPLTLTRPKPLLKVGNITIIEHNIDQIKEIVDEIIIVTGYMGEKIEEYVSANYKGIKFVKQKQQKGTGDALLCVEDLIKDEFVVMNGDDLYSGFDIWQCMKNNYCALAKEEKEKYRRFGVFILNDGYIVDAVEKPKEPISILASTGLFVLDKKIFEHIKKLPKPDFGEYYLIDAVKALAKENKVYCEKVKDYWCPIGYPWDLLNANKTLLDRLEPANYGKIHDTSKVYDKLFLGEGSEIRDFCVIEGPVIIGDNCKIGPFAHIRPYSVVGDNCIIGEYTILKNAIIFENTGIAHRNYIGDSIIGSNVNFGVGADATNLKLNRKEVGAVIEFDYIKTGLKKFGAIVGDGAQIGGHVKLNPGSVIQPDELVLKDR